MWALGWRQGINFVPPRGAEARELAVVGHLWPPRDEAQGYPRRFTADEWKAFATADPARHWYSPVRHPAASAWSLRFVHGFSWERVRACYRQMVEWARTGIPELVDIRQLKPQNVKGSGQRDRGAWRRAACVIFRKLLETIMAGKHVGSAAYQSDLSHPEPQSVPQGKQGLGRRSYGQRTGTG